MCESHSVGILKFNWIQLEFLISNGVRLLDFTGRTAERALEEGLAWRRSSNARHWTDLFDL